MPTMETRRALTRNDVERIKQALLEKLAPVADPEAVARSLILAFRAVEEVAAPSEAPSTAGA